MNIKEIVAKYLKENGYDGLVLVDESYMCGCHLDEFMWCDGPHITECMPAIELKSKIGHPGMFPGEGEEKER
jgi:hypothetical protein